ncbi:DoxX family protein [Vibrio sp. JC009]|uniref:DoxX family protein n=1 Tax=Vibrio sp. JC009 TaxID=2912314 RepID=UPI0023AE78B6|nr:DoxX family protein [Vibrio sp. JC009]WED21797.1 DoxX family protein [Vibrio sp. JC009]
MSQTLKNAIEQYESAVIRIQNAILPALLLFLRLWVAWVFFQSGLNKLSAWDSTLYLFQLEYQVPLLHWELAAYLATATELALPVFLALGLLTRLTTVVLFLFNIVAVISYPVLWEQGFYDHQLWGLMLAISIIWGAGSLSLDQLIRKKFK